MSPWTEPFTVKNWKNISYVLFIFSYNCKAYISASMFSHRGAALCRESLRVTCPGHSVSAETVKKLSAVCDMLKDSAATFCQHGYTTHAAETTIEQATTLR